MSDSESEFLSLSKKLRETPKKSPRRGATFHILRTNRRSYAVGTEYRTVLEYDGVTADGVNTRVVCFSDRESFAALVQVGSGEMVSITDHWAPTLGKWVIQPMTQVSSLGRSSGTPVFAECPLDRVPNLTGYLVARGRPVNFTGHSNGEVFEACTLCRLPAETAVCVNPDCSGRVRFGLRGHLTVGDATTTVRGLTGLNTIANATDLDQRQLIRQLIDSGNAAADINAKLRTGVELKFHFFVDIIHGRQVTSIVAAEPLDDVCGGKTGKKIAKPRQ